MGLEISITNNSDAFLNELKRRIPVALEAVGGEAEGDVKLRTPVDTGRLRNSITHMMEGDDTVVIGTNVEYAAYVEMGTRKMDAQPYLKPGIEENLDKYGEILERALKGW